MAEESLAASRAIDLGSVEEGDAKLQRSADDRERFVLGHTGRRIPML